MMSRKIANKLYVIKTFWIKYLHQKLTLSILSVLSFIIEAWANLSNIALRIFLLWIGWCFKKISIINFLLNIVREMSFSTEIERIDFIAALVQICEYIKFLKWAIYHYSIFHNLTFRTFITQILSYQSLLQNVHHFSSEIKIQQWQHSICHILFLGYSSSILCIIKIYFSMKYVFARNSKIYRMYHL